MNTDCSAARTQGRRSKKSWGPKCPQHPFKNPHLIAAHCIYAKLTKQKKEETEQQKNAMYLR